MRSLLAIVSLSLLVFFQGAEACCGNEASEHAHVEKASDGSTDQIVLHSPHGEKHGPCSCLCHGSQQDEKSSMPAPRIEFEPLPMIPLAQWNTLPEHTLPPKTGPPASSQFSLPPLRALDLCSMHCRFTIWSPDLNRRFVSTFWIGHLSAYWSLSLSFVRPHPFHDKMSWIKIQYTIFLTTWNYSH